MRCPSCGANVTGAFCEYCDSKMPDERVEAQTINAENVTVNNYYYSEAQQAAPAKGWNGSQNAHPNADYGQTANESAVYGQPASSKSRGIALLLCFFLGMFGAHRFYVGRYLMGAVYFFTFGAFGFAWLVDLVLILFGRMEDRYGLPVSRW